MKSNNGSGTIYIVSILALIGLISLLTSYIIRMKMIEITNENAQDAVALSNLASALLDQTEYEKTRRILVKDFERSYLVYVDSLQENMNLSYEMFPRNSYITSKVEIFEYSIYNVEGKDITQIQRTLRNGIAVTETLIYRNQVGFLKTPDGITITNTTIYSKIGFSIKGIMNQTHQVYKDGCVDLVEETK
jgi:hypothetical protein